MRRAGWEGSGGWWLTTLFALLAMSPSTGQAQLPVSVWVRPLLALPLGDLRGQEEGLAARTSFGLDAGGAVAIGSLSVYGEYQEVRFACGECSGAGLTDEALDRGWGAGVVVPVLGEQFGLAPWARLGVIAHHLRIRSVDEAAYSGRSLGWSTGVGARVSPLRWLRVEPSVMLRSYDATFGFAIDVPDRDLSVTYLSFGLAVAIQP
jgi:hypothetical protein